MHEVFVLLTEEDNNSIYREQFLELINEEKKENRNALAQLRQIKDIALHCQAYEVNVKWDIKEIE